FLVLLILGNQIVHVAFSFCELHFVHTFTSVPMQESLTTEHSSELFDTFEEFLDGGRVTNEGGHFQTSWWDVTNSGLYVVWNPFNKHLFVDFLHGHTATENSGYSQVTSMSWITGGHHVFGVEHLLGLKICPNGPERTESMVPGSKSTKTARGTYLPPEASL
uniref:Dipeptidylpeptidase IV N-terminal domain-containing protein n=1 Tax=Megaselia scalaris TaxID=36166 RepID=T1H6A3_MEGSC